MPPDDSIVSMSRKDLGRTRNTERAAGGHLPSGVRCKAQAHLLLSFGKMHSAQCHSRAMGTCPLGPAVHHSSFRMKIALSKR